MKKYLLSIILLTTIFFSLPREVMAACDPNYNCTGGCERLLQCVNNKRCVLDNDGNTIQPTGGACGSAQFGTVTPPRAITISNWVSTGGSSQGIGLIIFLSRLINLFVIICGIWTMFNFLYCGYLLITAQSDTKAQQEIREKLTMTVIGITIIAGAYILAGLIGLIFFGDAGYILNPTITGAVDL